MLTVLFSNDDILVINKPRGLAVQPGEGVRISVVDAVERDFGFKPFLVHRLDKETEGCLIVAKTSRAAAFFSELLSSHLAVKNYRAIVSGETEHQGVYKDKVISKGKEANAETRFKTILTDGMISVVDIEIGTGRMHQIRQHFAQAGHPIIGDDKHGDFKLNKKLAKEYGAKKLFLHAQKLYIPLNPPVTCISPVPEHFKAFYERWPFGNEHLNLLLGGSE